MSLPPVMSELTSDPAIQAVIAGAGKQLAEALSFKGEDQPRGVADQGGGAIKGDVAQGGASAEKIVQADAAAQRMDLDSVANRLLAAGGGGDLKYSFNLQGRDGSQGSSVAHNPTYRGDGPGFVDLSSMLADASASNAGVLSMQRSGGAMQSMG